MPFFISFRPLPNLATTAALMAVTIVVAPLRAEPAAARPLSIEELVDQALADNPELKFYEAELAAAHGEQRNAGAFANPEFNLQLGSERRRDETGAHEGLGYAASVRQTFEFPGRVSLRKAIANRQIDLARVGLEQFRATLAARVRVLAYALFTTREKAQATRRASDDFQELIAAIVQRESAGAGPLLETRILEGNAIALQRRSTRATQEYQDALLELNGLRAKPLDGEVTISPPQLEFPAAKPRQEILMAARENNFELRSRRLELSQQGFKVALSKNERLPAITLAPFYEHKRTDEREDSAGVGVTFALPLFNQNKGNIQSAQARLAQAQASLAATQREVERKVLGYALAYETLTADLGRLRADSAERLREAAELAGRSYRLGAIPISTYLETQNRYLEALDALLDTRREALESRLQLELSTGSPRVRRDALTQTTARTKSTK